MTWADDKLRMEQLGPAILTLIGALLVLCVLSVISMTLVFRAAESFGPSLSDEFTGLVLRHKLLAAAKVLLYFLSAIFLFFSRSRWAVFFVIATMVFGFGGSLISLIGSISSVSLSAFPIVKMVDLLVFCGIVGFLLFSSDVATVYQTGTRKLLTRDAGNMWQRIRGRPTLDQIEAARLDETFN